jgi:chaperonin cofactor prefoldin
MEIKKRLFTELRQAEVSLPFLKDEKHKEYTIIQVEKLEAAIEGIERWEDAIRSKIKKLQKRKVDIPKFSLFGDNQHEEIDEQIKDLQKKLN